MNIKIRSLNAIYAPDCTSDKILTCLIPPKILEANAYFEFYFF